jgi:dTDP-4-dehydrorhamnose reductase
MEVLTSELRYTGLPNDPLVGAVRASPADWVINAIGKLNVATSTPAEMLMVNAQFPVHLKSYLRPGQRLIHASTDGVFSGKTGNYTVDAERDASDIYGFSKILGEVVAEAGKSIVLRTSVIGLGGTTGSGLLHWFFRQSRTVPGFRNHFWNGITTLEWAKVCSEFIHGDLLLDTGILQPVSAEPVSKFEILELVRELWNHPVEVCPAEARVRVDRTLSSKSMRGSILQQLREFKGWYQSA